MVKQCVGCGWVVACMGNNMTLDHGHCLTQVSPSQCRWAGASRGLNRLWLRPPGACRAGLVVMLVGGAAAVRRAVLGLISHAALSLLFLAAAGRLGSLLLKK